MADYLTTDTELTSIADAIRAKGGTSASLTYPTGFVSAIQAIPTGGGGTVNTCTMTIDAGGVTCSNFSDHTPTGRYIAVAVLDDNALYPIVAVYSNTTNGSEGFALFNGASSGWSIEGYDPYGYSFMGNGMGEVVEDPDSGLSWVADSWPGGYTATVIEY